MRYGLLLVVAAVLFAAGCSAGLAPGHADHRGSAVTEVQSSAAVVTGRGPVPRTTLRHWGSLFGNTPGNVNTLASPVEVTLPGTVAQIGTSNSTDYALLTDGSLYAWGLGSQGELGDGSLRNSLNVPVRVRFPAGVRIASIPVDAMPFDTGLAVDTNGNVWGWGNNGGGELCLGNSKLYRTPVRLPLTDVTAVAGASTHALFDSAGTVYACGQNLDGDLGDGSWHGTRTPVAVTKFDGRDVVKLVASFANSGALLSNGKYYDWGYNGAGQLGDGITGKASDVPVRVHLPHPVVKVAQGGSIWNNGQTLAKLSNGSLWAWGNNRAGQLGDGRLHRRSRPVRFYAPAGVRYRSLATGSATSYAVSSKGNVYAWGVSYEGQLGDGFLSSTLTPVLIATGVSAISSTANNVLIK